MSQAIDTVLRENRVFPPPEALARTAAIGSETAYQGLCAEAETDFNGFWTRLAREHLQWDQDFTQVLDESNPPFFRWFHDGTLNVSANCLDRHLAAGLGDKTAIIFESDDGQVSRVSYQDLHARVCQLANALQAAGYKTGDRAVVYLPMSVEAVVIMQACARLGIIHSVVFGGFSAKSLQERIADTGAVLVFTADAQRRGGKAIPLKPALDEAIALGGCEAVRQVVVYRRTGDDIAWHAERDIWLDEFVAGHPQSHQAQSFPAEQPLFILYTSGSTGKPKGVQHASGGYLLWAKLTMEWTFDIKPEDVFWCTADVGWITGHTYIAYGPLAAGATQIIFEGVPTYPDSARFWRMIEAHGVSVFYTAPTAIRSLIKAAEANPEIHPSKFNLDSLRIIGSVGEPINPEAWMWYYQNVGRERCPVIDTWWQTETGGHVLVPLPGATPTKPGSCARPLPGMFTAVVDETGQEVPAGKGGFLVIRRPWPAMARTLWGDPERFKRSYFPEHLGGDVYLAGDGANIDQDGYYWIMGRIDDVLNVSGHRMGTMEIESVLVAHPKVAEAAVVGRPDDVTGEAVVAFVVLTGPVPEGEEAVKVANELRAWVAQEIGPIAKPREFRFGENLPKTRSGKIMRRLLRVVAQGEEVTQDVSTLENPHILEQLTKAV